VFPLLYQLAGVGDLLRRQQALAAHLYATRHNRRAARLCSLLNQRPFKLCGNADHLPHGAASRSFRVVS